MVQRVGLLDRLAARLQAPALYGALAAGAAQRDAATALHARRLCSRSMRERLAGALFTVIAEGAYGRRARAKVPWRARACGVPRTSSPGWWTSWLQPGPVDPAGVAQVRLLLSDGGGPLYNPRSDDDLEEPLVRGPPLTR